MSGRITTTALLALVSVFATNAAAALVWETRPASAENHGGGRGESFLLAGGVDATARMWKPTLETMPVKVSRDNGVTPPRTGMNNYHLLVAEQDTAGIRETALRYLPRNGKPTGHSPSELLAADKAALEIVPRPLPREHRHYKTGEEYRFRIRFNGTPLTDAEVDLTTEHGSRLSARTDHDGYIRFRLPMDFTEVREGRRANPPAEMVLSVGHQGPEREYRTSLSANYYVNPGEWRSTDGGVAVAGLGFVAGLVGVGINRRRRRHTDKGRGAGGPE